MITVVGDVTSPVASAGSRTAPIVGEATSGRVAPGRRSSWVHNPYGDRGSGQYSTRSTGVGALGLGPATRNHRGHAPEAVVSSLGSLRVAGAAGVCLRIVAILIATPRVWLSGPTTRPPN